MCPSRAVRLRAGCHARARAAPLVSYNASCAQPSRAAKRIVCFPGVARGITDQLLRARAEHRYGR